MRILSCSIAFLVTASVAVAAPVWDFSASNGVSGAVVLDDTSSSFAPNQFVTLGKGITSFSFTQGTTTWSTDDNVISFDIELGANTTPADLRSVNVDVVDNASGRRLQIFPQTTIATMPNGELEVRATNVATVTNGTFAVAVGAPPDPATCQAALQGPANAYQSLVRETLAQQLPAIAALVAAGDAAGAAALQTATVNTLVQEANSAVGATQTACADCVAALQGGSEADLIPHVQNECIEQVHRIGAMQASAVSQLEDAVGTVRPARIALSIRDAYLRAIRRDATRAAATLSGAAARMERIIRRNVDRGNTQTADATLAAARNVLQKTSTARFRRIQHLCDKFASRVEGRAGASGVIAEVTSAANLAMAEIQLAESRAVLRVQNAHGE